MQKAWTDDAWIDYLYWQTQDKKSLKRINNLLKDINREPYSGIGKPEPLVGDKQGYWSRRIDERLRIIQDDLDAKNFYAFNPAFDKPQC